MVLNRFFTLMLLGSLLLPSCVYRSTLRHVHAAHHKTSLYLKMPENSTVHQNTGPLLYQALFIRLQQIGYSLLDDQNEAAYVLDTKIKYIRHPEKLISPDVVLYGYRCIITVECTLTHPQEHEGKNKLKKTFSLPVLISNPKNPMLGSHFLVSATQEQLDQAVTPIIQWIERIIMTSPCR